MSGVKVLIWGLGAMGSGMARMLLSTENVRVVGAIAQRSEKAGRDLGEVIGLSPVGVKVTTDPDVAFSQQA